MRPRAATARAGFSLIEALVAVTVVAASGVVLLLGVEATLRTAGQAEEQVAAQGLAEQLLHEAVGWPHVFKRGDPYQYPLTPNSWEQGGAGRERFSDSDDFNGFRAQPPEDLWGEEAGQGDGQGGLRHPAFRLRETYFDRWKQECDVYYVDEDDPSQPLAPYVTSNLRCTEVRILHQDADGTYRPLAAARRVHAYVPPLP